MTQIWASGGGVQSAAIAALIVRGDIRPDLAVIADTGREQSTTWHYMESVTAPALLSVGIDLVRVRSSSFATVDLYGGANGNTLLIPAFTDESGETGKLPGYCSNEWKRRVLERWARSIGVSEGVFWIGISTDEKGRMRSDSGKWKSRYPLIEQRMSRNDCMALVARMGWPTPPRSSCWMCPNHTQEEWRDIKNNKPADWRMAVQFDRYIRRKDKHAFLHHDAIPLDQADLEDRNGVLFSHCDSGHCFN